MRIGLGMVARVSRLVELYEGSTMSVAGVQMRMQSRVVRQGSSAH